MTPEDLARQVGGPRLEVHARRLRAALHEHNNFKLLLGQLARRQVIQRRLLVNNVNNVQRPDEEDAVLGIRIRKDLQHVHLLVQLALLGDASAQQLGRDAGAEDKVLVAEVADAEDETEPAVALCDDSVLGEDDRLGAAARSGELREDQAHHEGLDEAAQDRLEGHEDHGLRAFGGGLPAAVANGVLGFQREEEAGGEAVNFKDAGRPSAHALVARQVLCKYGDACIN